MRAVAILACLALAGPAAAEGFAVDDLRRLSVQTDSFAGCVYDVKTERRRMVLACKNCEALTFIDVQLGESRDGNEARFRLGETTVEEIEALCQQREPACEVQRADVGEAVGWLSTYPIGAAAGSTLVLFRDTDLLQIRVMSGDAGTTLGNALAAIGLIAKPIIGTEAEESVQ